MRFSSRWLYWFGRVTTPCGWRFTIRRRADTTSPGHRSRSKKFETTRYPGPGDYLPIAEFPDRHRPFGDLSPRLSGDLSLPVANERPLQIELISTLSTAEQWAGEGMSTRHNRNVQRALLALSDIDLSAGSISITGIDLVRREVLFEQRDFSRLDVEGLAEAVNQANTQTISLSALTDRRINAQFLTNLLEQRLSPVELDDRATNDDEKPFRVFILVTGFWRFERGSDLTPVQIEADCDCRLYHIRTRLNRRDLFDDIGKLVKPLRPRTFDVLTPEDLREAIAEILEELQTF